MPYGSTPGEITAGTKNNNFPPKNLSRFILLNSYLGFCVAQSQAGVDHEADYRALTKDGGYVWIRDVVHVIRENGEVDSLVGFISILVSERHWSSRFNR